MVNIKHPVPFFRPRSYTVHLVQGLNLHWMIPLSQTCMSRPSGFLFLLLPLLPLVKYMIAQPVHIVNTLFCCFYVFCVLHNLLLTFLYIMHNKTHLLPTACGGVSFSLDLPAQVDYNIYW